jgi:hypothetical protein
VKEIRPVVYSFGDNKHGTCKKLVDGKRCGKPFTGPPNRKYCAEHSASIQYSGRSL